MSSDERVAGGLGLLGVALTTVSGPVLPIWGFPSSDVSDAGVAEFARSHHDRLLAGTTLDVVGLMLWAVLCTGVWLRLRRRNGDSLATTCFLVGSVLFVAALMTGFLVFLVLLRGGADSATVGLLYDLTFGMLAISGAPTVLALAAYAWERRLEPGWPRVTVVSACLGVVGHLVVVASVLVPHGFFSLEGQIITAGPATLFLWLALAGADLVRRPPRVAG